jgi:hypothetical protein
MSSKAYAVQLRNDLPQGVLQVLDLKPNTSQRNSIYEGEGKTGYVRADLSADLSAPTIGDDGGLNKIFSGESTGLVAYLIERVENTVPGTDTHLTVAQAQRCASLIIADVLSGTDIDSARITVHLTAICAGAVDLDGGLADSWGSVEDVVKILAGHTYTIADGTTLALVASDEFVVEASRSAKGSFSAFVGIVPFQGSSFNNSLASGNLSQYVSSSYAVSNSKTLSGLSKVDYTYGVDQKEESSYSYNAKAVLGSTILPVVATISSSTVAVSSTFTTTADHGLEVGDKVWIVHHNGTLVRTGADTGAFTVKAKTGDTFTLEDSGDIECTVALSAGSVVLTDGTAQYSIPKSTASVGTNLSATVGQHAAVRYIDEDGVILA